MPLTTLYTDNKLRSKFAETFVTYYKLDVKLSGGSLSSADFAAKFPMKKVPALIAPKGYKLHEVIAITLYFINQIKDENKDGLLGSTPEDLPQVLKWMSFTNSELVPALATAIKSLRGDIPYNKKSVDSALATADQIVSVFEARLVNYTFLVGERITAADLFCAALATFAFKAVWGTKWRAEHPVFVRWFNTVIGAPFFKDSAVTKDFKFTDKPLEFVPPKKEKKPKTEAKPKAEAKPKEVVEEEPAPKKAKHPLEALGKPTIALDEWKRCYSNEDTREKALPYFWNTFYNPEEWSLWRVDYKYNDELTLTFMSNNLIGGFFARLSGSLKYIFGSMVVYGENNNNGITGAFLIRGQDFKPAFDVAPDWESYSFTKLDAKNEEDVKFLNNSWAWDEPMIINGEKKEIADGKVCK